MSILLAESMTRAISPTVPTSLPGSVVPTTGPVDHSQTILFFFLAWGLAGLLLAAFLGAFGRKSIVGPPRLTETDSAWDLMLVLFISFFAGSLADLALMGIIHPSPGAKMLLLQAAVDLATFVSVVALLARFLPGSLRLLGLDPRRLIDGIAGGTITLIVVFPLIQLTSETVEILFNYFHFAKAKPHEILQLLSNTQDRRITIFAIFLAVVVAPFTEELLYRGLLQTSLSRLFSWILNRELASPGPAARWAAVLITSMIFAAIHIEPAFLAPIFVLALGLGYAYERTGNLWITITAHALFNTAQIVLYLSLGH
jgi:membrane protease YdiL (CAAX protease family)